MALNREAVVRTAEKYVGKGKIDAAIREYRKVLEENPNDTNTLNRVGDLYARISRIDEAVKLFVQIADQYSADGFYVKAIAIFKKIIKLDPARLEIYERLADLYAKQGLKTEARTQFQVLADYYLKHQQAASAINIHLRMAELEPDNPSHYLKLAELYQGQQLWDKAMRSYRTIAEMMLERGAVEEATQVYLRAFEVKSDDLPFITEVVMGMKDAGHAAAAAKLLAAAVAKNPQAERVARLAGFGGRGESDPGDETVGVRVPAPNVAAPASPRPVVQRVPPPPQLEDEEFVVEIEDDAPASLVAPPADMGSSRGFGFRHPPRPAPVDDDGGFEIELDLDEEPASAILDLASVRQMVAPEIAEPEEFELELDLDFGEAGLVAEPSAAAPPQIEIEHAPELPDFSADFELEEVAEAPAPTALGMEEPEFELDLDLDGGDPWDGSVLPPAAAAESEVPEEEFEFAEGLGLEEELAAGAMEPAAPAPVAPAPVAPPLVESAVVESVVEAPRPVAAVVVPPVALPPPPPESSLVDLLAEAEVFGKYGLEEKALDRLRQVLGREPEHFAAQCLEVEIYLKQRNDTLLLPAVARTARLASRLGDTTAWPKLAARLEKAGYSPTGTRVAAPAGPKQPDRIAQLLGDLGMAQAKPKRPSADVTLDALMGGLGVKPAAPRPVGAPTPAPTPVAGPVLAPVVAPAVAPAPPVPPVVAAPVVTPPVPPTAVPPPAPAPTPVQVAAPTAPPVAAVAPAAAPAAATPAPPPRVEFPTFAEPTLPLRPYDEAAFDDELPDIVFPERRIAPAAAAAKAMAAPAEDALDWLDEPAPAKGRDDALFDDEEDFFDLAAELEEELDRDDVLVATGSGTPEEPSLEEIVEGFKKGVAEHLSEEDYDTHYNLGIAYREMGLLDEAVGEFQLSSKSPLHFVDSCAMLGLCFLEKGLPDLGIKWYQKALAHSGNSEETTLGLLYDLGSVYLNMGDEESAYKTFVEVYGLNSNYRDIVAVLEDLKHSVGRA